MALLQPAPLIIIPLAFAAGVILLVRSMGRMRPRSQLLVLVGLGLTIGFTFLVMVQLPQFPEWLGISLVVVALTAAPFATRLFVRSVMQEDEEKNRSDSGPPGGSGENRNSIPNPRDENR